MRIGRRFQNQFQWSSVGDHMPQFIGLIFNLIAVAMPSALPAIAAVPGDVKSALPALTVMVVNGGVNVLLAVLILTAGWLVARWVGRWVQGLTGRSQYLGETLKPLITN